MFSLRESNTLHHLLKKKDCKSTKTLTLKVLLEGIENNYSKTQSSVQTICRQYKGALSLRVFACNVKVYLGITSVMEDNRALQRMM